MVRAAHRHRECGRITGNVKLDRALIADIDTDRQAALIANSVMVGKSIESASE